MTCSKAELQDEEYLFPYHYVPNLSVAGIGSNIRFLRWGLEYLCYLRHMAWAVQSLSPGSVLDVGCGDGRLFSLLEVDEGTRLVGVDFSERPLSFARAFNPRAEFVMGDAGDLTEEFDVVTAVEVLEHIPDEGIGAFLQALSRRVRPEGHCLLSVPTVAQPVTAKHYRHYTGELLEAQLASSAAPLQVVSLEYVYRQSRLVDAMTRLTLNRFLCCEVAFVRRWLWAYTWRHLRRARSSNGRHLVALLRRSS